MKKGFTLVELIAVIAIIGIILLISVTTISNTISDEKKETYKDSVEGIIQSAELYSLKLNDTDLTNNYYVFSYSNETLKFGDKVIETSSTIPNTSGYIYVDAKGLGSAFLYRSDLKYCYRGNSGNYTLNNNTDSTSCQTSGY